MCAALCLSADSVKLSHKSTLRIESVRPSERLDPPIHATSDPIETSGNRSGDEVSILILRSGEHGNDPTRPSDVRRMTGGYHDETGDMQVRCPYGEM